MFVFKVYSIKFSSHIHGHKHLNIFPWVYAREENVMSSYLVSPSLSPSLMRASVSAWLNWTDPEGAGLEDVRGQSLASKSANLYPSQSLSNLTWIGKP